MALCDWTVGEYEEMYQIQWRTLAVVPFLIILSDNLRKGTSPKQ